MSNDLIEIAWRPREPPLLPLAIAAQGSVARALVKKILQRFYETELSGVASASPDQEALVILIGEAARLPWIDGAVYLGRDPAAPSLLVPTNLEPSVPAALLERAIGARITGRPIAVLPDPPRIASLEAALPIGKSALLAWLEPSVLSCKAP